MEFPNLQWGLITAVLLAIGSLVWVFSALEIKIDPNYRGEAIMFLAMLIGACAWIMYEVKLFVDWRIVLVLAGIVFIYGTSRALKFPRLIPNSRAGHETTKL